MKGRSGGVQSRSRQNSPTTSSNNRSDCIPNTKPIKGGHDFKFNNRSSNRPSFIVKSMANKKNAVISKTQKRKNKVGASNSDYYSGPSTSQMLVSSQYRTMEQEPSDQYLKPVTALNSGPLKGVASGQTKIYSQPPNAPMKRNKKSKKTGTGNKVSSGGYLTAPDDNQFVKVSAVATSSQKVITKSSRNITSLSNIEIDQRKKNFDPSDKAYNISKVSSGSKLNTSKQNDKSNKLKKSPRSASRSQERTDHWARNKSAERTVRGKDTSEQKIISHAEGNAAPIFYSGRKPKENDKYNKDKSTRSKMASNAPGGTGFRSNKEINLYDDPSERSQFISGESDCISPTEQMMYNDECDRTQMVATPGAVFNSTDRSKVIPTKCERPSMSDSFIAGQTSSQALDKEKVFYKEPIEGFDSLMDSETCRPIYDEKLLQEECKFIDQNKNEYSRFQDQQPEQWKINDVKVKCEPSRPKERPVSPYIEEHSTQQDQRRSKNAFKDKNEPMGEDIAAQKFTLESVPQSEQRRNKVVCKDKNDPTKSKVESSAAQKFIDESSPQSEQRRNKVVCKDKNDTTKSKSDHYGTQKYAVDSVPQSEQKRNKVVCKDKKDPTKSKGEHIVVESTEETVNLPEGKRSKVACKDKSAGAKQGDKSKESLADRSMKSQGNASLFSFLGFGPNKGEQDSSKRIVKDQSRGFTSSKPSSAIAGGSSGKKSPQLNSLSTERKILYGTAALALLLLLGGAGLYYMDMLELD